MVRKSPSKRARRQDGTEANDNDSTRTVDSQHHMDVDQHTTKQVGVIESVELKNFMCHKNFEINLGSRINFVIGRNGSGKSAILTAVVLVLGGRATNTSRGLNVKSFIKTGESSARLTIKLCNYDGFDRSASFKYEEYGDSIIVERVIRSDGGSTYAMKSVSSRGKIISNKREELDDIVKHFCIQIDNPACILNQEVSRSFINSKNARDKYSFFMKATLLEKLQNDYAITCHQNRETRDLLNTKKSLSRDLVRDIKEYKEKVDTLNKMDDYRNRRQYCLNELLWASLRDKESECQKMEKEINGAATQIENKQRELCSLESELSEVKKEESCTTLRLKAIDEKFNKVLKEKKEAIVRLNVMKSDHKTKLSDLESIKSQIKKFSDMKERLLKRIHEFQNRFRDQIAKDREREDALAKKQELQEQLNILKTEFGDAKCKKDQLNESIAPLNDEVVGRKREVDILNGKIRKSEDDMKNLEGSIHDKLRRFGHNMPELIKRIANSSFKEKPVGPIGAYIKLKDPNCAVAVEACLKGLIYAFCCDNSEDGNRLSRIMNEVYGPNAKTPTIIARKFTRRHDVSRFAVCHDEYKSILDLMDIPEDPVVNCIIDKCSAESILYIPDTRIARNMLSNLNTVPHNCHQAYTKDGTQIYPQTCSSVYRQYAGERRRNSLLEVSVDGRMRELKQEIVDLKRKKVAAEKEANEKISILHKNKTDLVNMEKILNDMKSKCRVIEAQLVELRNIEDAPNFEISTFEEELVKCTEDETKARSFLEETNKEVSAALADYEQADSAVKEKEEKVKALMRERETCDAKMKQIEDVIEKNTRSSEILTLKLNQINLNQEGAMTDLSNMQLEVKKCYAVASKNHPDRIETDRSCFVIKNESDRIQQLLTEREKDIGSRDAIVKKYNELKSRYDDTHKLMEKLETLLVKFGENIKMRDTYYMGTREFVTKNAADNFSSELEKMGFIGNLGVFHTQEIGKNGESHKEKTLEIRVNPKPKSRGDQTDEPGSEDSEVYNDTRSLSGGERSYSTVAFLLALWSNCYSPFRILDEVDVFMDMVTRKVSMEALIESAKRKSGKQFIFLSPLPLIQNVYKSELVRVFEMSNPERGSEQSNN